MTFVEGADSVFSAIFSPAPRNRTIPSFPVFLPNPSLGNPCHVTGLNSTSIGPGLTFRHVLLSKSLLGLRRLWLWVSEDEDVSGRCYGSGMDSTDGLVRCGG